MQSANTRPEKMPEGLLSFIAQKFVSAVASRLKANFG